MNKNNNYKKNILNNKPKTLNDRLIKEWHLTKNGDLTPSDVTCGSDKKVWWQCDKGHEWQAKINNRQHGNNCPYCSNHKIVKGYTDLQTINPKLAQQWHPTKNGDLSPSDVFPNSNKKVWWLCDQGHKWQAKINNRNNGTNCPICSNQKILKGYNDLKTKNPVLSKQWHPTKNGDLKPSDVFPNSNKKVWWLCDHGHEWQALINNRTKGKNCPYCSNKKHLKGYNDLQTKNHTLSKEWHPTKNGDLKPSDVTFSSDKKVWWQCDKGHEWQSIVYNRTKGTNCPYCSNKKILKGYNDLATINPTLAKQWHPTKNGDLLPSDVTCGSGKKVWWQCEKGHEWQSKVNDRKKNNCSICSNEMKTSFPEQVIYYYLSQIFKSISNRKLINKKEADIFIEDLNLIIEYDGTYFHKHKNQLDRDKNKAFQDYHFVRIRENGLTSIEDYGCINYILKNTSHQQLEEMIYFILDYIMKNFTLTKKTLNKINKLNIDLNRDQIKIYNNFILKEKESSLQCINSTVAKQWHPTKNGLLTPEHVFPNSNKKVWWQCDKGHEWQATINSRNNGTNCPYCGNRKLLKGFNDLKTKNPNLAKEWHPTKNDNLNPNDVFSNSTKKVWWKCEKGHEWQSKILYRNNGTKCPYCNHKKVK